MKLTRAVKYAMKLMVYMAGKEKGIVISRNEVAKEEDLPLHFLAKIAQELAKDRLIEVRSGSQGGFVLTCDPYQTTLLEIAECVLGDIDIGFEFDDGSRLGIAINDINDELCKLLAEKTLADLAVW